MTKSESSDTRSPLYSFHSPDYHSPGYGVGQEAGMKFVGRQCRKSEIMAIAPKLMAMASKILAIADTQKLAMAFHSSSGWSNSECPLRR
jgi:hypothetical protein